jgi:hypothetical protein
VGVVVIGAVAERGDGERDGSSEFHSGLYGVGSREAVEEVVEGAVLLHDDDDVLDGRGGIGGVGGAGGVGERRDNAAAAARAATDQQGCEGRKDDGADEAGHDLYFP